MKQQSFQKVLDNPYVFMQNCGGFRGWCRLL